MNNMLVNAIVENSASDISAPDTETRTSDKCRGHDIASQPSGQTPDPSISAPPSLVRSNGYQYLHLAHIPVFSLM